MEERGVWHAGEAAEEHKDTDHRREGRLEGEGDGGSERDRAESSDDVGDGDGDGGWSESSEVYQYSDDGSEEGGLEDWPGKDDDGSYGVENGTDGGMEERRGGGEADEGRDSRPGGELSNAEARQRGRRGGLAAMILVVTFSLLLATADAGRPCAGTRAKRARAQGGAVIGAGVVAIAVSAARFFRAPPLPAARASSAPAPTPAAARQGAGEQGGVPSSSGKGASSGPTPHYVGGAVADGQGQSTLTIGTLNVRTLRTAKGLDPDGRTNEWAEMRGRLGHNSAARDQAAKEGRRGNGAL
jgi:hypothetical protein